MRTFGVSLHLRELQGKGRAVDVLLGILDGWFANRSAAKRDLARTISTEVRAGQTLHHFQFEQPGDADGRWVTVVRALEGGGPAGQVAVSIEMNLEDVADRMAPLRVVVRPPGFLRDLRGECIVETIDGFEAPQKVLQVEDVGQVELLANEIFGQDRKLPLVVATDPVYERPLITDLPGKLARYLFGLGRVVHVSPRMTYSLTDSLGKELSVFDGGVRIYWPGAAKSDFGPRHPLFLRWTQRCWGPDERSVERELLARVAQSLILAAAPRFRLAPELAAFIQRIDRERVEASSGTVQELKAFLADRDRKLAEEVELAQLALSENQEKQARIVGLEEELKVARKALYDERAKSAALQAALRGRGGVPEEAAAPAEPSTADEAVGRAAEDFSEHLVLPPDLELETDLGPGVYALLQAMSEACAAERAGAKRDRALFQDRLASRLGHPGRYEPGSTGLVYVYEGRKIDIRDRIHLKSSRPADTESVYFAPLGTVADRKYLVMRIGRHA